MNAFDVPCPTCGAQAGALCLSADILEGVKEIKGGHKKRRQAALQQAVTLLSQHRRSPEFPDRLDFRAYGGVVEPIDKTSPMWHMLKRVQPLMKTWPSSFTGQLVELITRMQALDELRAQGAQEDVLQADKDALRTLTLAFLEEHYPENKDKYDTLLTIMGVL